MGGTSLEIGADGQRIGELGWDTGRSFLCTANIVNELPGCTSSTLNTWLPAGPDGDQRRVHELLLPAAVVPGRRRPGRRCRSATRRCFGPVPLRVVPDISLDADPGTGFLIGLHQTLPSGAVEYTTTRYGGTSLASPMLAGIVADADQAAGQCRSGSSTRRIYRIDQTRPSSIFDVLPEPSLQGNFRQDFAGPIGEDLGTSGYADSFRELYYSGPETFCDTSGNCTSSPETQSATKGYDSLTGLGSPGTNFVNALAGVPGR